MNNDNNHNFIEQSLKDIDDMRLPCLSLHVNDPFVSCLKSFCCFIWKLKCFPSSSDTRESCIAATIVSLHSARCQIHKVGTVTETFPRSGRGTLGRQKSWRSKLQIVQRLLSSVIFFDFLALMCRRVVAHARTRVCASYRFLSLRVHVL